MNLKDKTVNIPDLSFKNAYGIYVAGVGNDLVQLIGQYLRIADHNSSDAVKVEIIRAVSVSPRRPISITDCTITIGKDSGNE